MPPLSNLQRSCIALAVGQALLVPASQAATINVSVDCTLRNAILSANQDLDIGDCMPGSGADKINLPAAADYSYATTTFSYAGIDTMLPVIDSDIMIVGDAGGNTISRPMGNPATFRVLTVAPAAKLTLNNVTVSNGEAPQGGGIFVNDGELVLNNSAITGNSATTSGGGIALTAYSDFSMEGSTVSFNEASVAFGGIHSYNPGEFEISDSTISNNTAGTSSGGGIGIDGAAALLALTIDDSIITDNVSGDAGGGIYVYGQQLSISNITLSANQAAAGGGVYANDSSITIAGATIEDNYSSLTGGALQIKYSSSLVISDASLINNDSVENGGAICLYESDLSLHSSTISASNASGAGAKGGAVYVREGGSYTSSVTLINSTISGNQADESSALFLGTSDVNIYNSTIFNNTATGALPKAATLSSQVLPNIVNSVIAGSSGADCYLYGGQITNNNSWFQSASCDGVAAGSPLLNPLLDNNQGLPGLTLTHAPALSSGLVAAADITYCANNANPLFHADQRGATRGASSCTIGAVEGGIEGAFDSVCYVIVAANGNIITFCLD